METESPSIFLQVNCSYHKSIWDSSERFPWHTKF